MATASDPRDDPQREYASAGRAILVALLAVVIGTVLNAPGVYKAAYNRPEGWQRGVALALARPLVHASDALRLDRPRELLQDAVGRSGVDTVDVSITEPAATSPEPAVALAQTAHGGRVQPSGGGLARAEAGKPEYSPRRPLRVWIAGDSLVITPGYALVRAVGTNHAVVNVGGVDGQLATGLSRPDVFNWFREIHDQMGRLRPDVVVLTFGGNDDHPYMTGLPSGRSIGSFGDAAWRREYTRRVDIVLDTIARSGALAVWVGLPITRSPDQSRRFAVVNSVVRQAVKRHPDQAAYVPTAALLASPSGSYAQYLRVSGRLVDVRAPDGVHMAPAGGSIVAHHIVGVLQRHFDLTSWRKGQRRDA